MSDDIVVPERDMIYDIEAIEKDFASTNGYELENISHWDCGEAYKTRLLQIAEFTIPAVNFDYRYSRGNSCWNILYKFLDIPSTCNGLMCANGTSAVNLIATVLRQLGCQSVIQIDPSYYAMRHSWRALGFEVEQIAASISEPYFDPDKLALIDVLCVTEPMYSAGTVVSQHTWDLVDKAIAMGKAVVVDATLADPEHVKLLLSQYNNRIIMTTTPHKFIGVNDIKCSIITFDSTLKRAFDQWSGVTSGGLSVSVIAAAEHLASSNFQKCLDFAAIWKKEKLVSLLNLTKRMDSIRVLGPPMDHFAGVFVAGIPAAAGRDQIFLRDTFFKSGCSFIPQIRNGMTDELGFGIRVNLFRWSDRYAAGLSRALRVLVESVL